jgi:hypothetical protein
MGSLSKTEKTPTWKKAIAIIWMISIVINFILWLPYSGEVSFFLRFTSSYLQHIFHDIRNLWNCLFLQSYMSTNV